MKHMYLKKNIQLSLFSTMAISSSFVQETSVIAFFLFCLTPSSFSAVDIHELLPLFNLPKGLLPREIRSFSLSNTDNSSFTVELSSHPCYVNFNGQSVYYDKIIKGKLGYGKVSGVSGIQAKKLFIWVSVDGIVVRDNGDMIEFHVAALSQSLPAKDFQIVKSCKAKGLRESLTFTTASL